MFKSFAFTIVLLIALAGVVNTLHHVHEVDGIAKGLCYTHSCIQIGKTTYIYL